LSGYPTVTCSSIHLSIEGSLLHLPRTVTYFFFPWRCSSHLLEKILYSLLAKVPEGVRILNGDVGEDGAKAQAKALVAQLQSEKAHKQYHMIQELHTEIDVAEAELLHAPIWFARYDWNGKKIALVVDANSGGIINSIGLNE
jgi:hypothetical protein